MRSALITGGAGFFGELLLKRLLKDGWRCVSIDLEDHVLSHPNLTAVKGDIRDLPALERTFAQGSFGSAPLGSARGMQQDLRPFHAVFHLASILAHAVKDRNFLWTSNVDGTRNVAEMTKKFRIPSLVYTSSNCLWGHGMGRSVREEDEPKPVEIYGRSKWEGEKILREYAGDFNAVTIRCPTIVDEGRLGLLAILFAFIDEGRKVWVVGGGRNRYQFIYAQDLIDACLRAVDYGHSDVFNIGSDDVKTFREVYEYVIHQAGTGARVASFPRWIAIPLMKLAYALGLSPLGPYQYKMIAEDFVFDTAKIKGKLGWKPTLKNEDMLARSYRYFHDHRKEIEGRTNVSAHKQAAKMGVIRILKWLS
ncbi:MAG: NAD-dependent epimerase/dehydratase family protein [Patescibacteria group bacterium]